MFTNPILSIGDLSVDNKLGGTVSASTTLHLPSHGQALAAHIRAPGSRRRSPPAPSHGMSITMCSVPATPLAGISTISQLWGLNISLFERLTEESGMSQMYVYMIPSRLNAASVVTLLIRRNGNPVKSVSWAPH